LLHKLFKLHSQSSTHLHYRENIKNSYRHPRGFTLIELMVVLVVMSVALGLARTFHKLTRALASLLFARQSFVPSGV